MRAVRPWRIAAAATPGSSAEGMTCVLAAGAAVYSAYPDVPSQTTLSPTLKLYSFVPGPRETIVPSASRPRISGLGAGYSPVRKYLGW